MGASTAVGAADLLGTLVAEHPKDLHTALGTWERVLRPEVDAFQKIGVVNRVSFTPATEKESRQRYRRMTLIRSVISNRLLAPLLRLRSFRQRQQDLTALVRTPGAVSGPPRRIRPRGPDHAGVPVTGAEAADTLVGTPIPRPAPLSPGLPRSTLCPPCLPPPPSTSPRPLRRSASASP
ncbi:hypothetical protein [Brachybacterium squillarum]|uniref:hypothetical protein n=1 Tax=Brachybacterium squillarum TaxID=661979 RepID=UPI000262B1F3|nr:hypothetical protein [Brachybacterium squillarum]